MGDYYESFVTDEARALQFTLDELRAWKPAASAAMRRRKKSVTMSRLLVYPNTFDGPTGELTTAEVNLASALAYIVQNHKLAANQYHQPRELFVVENQLRGSTANPHLNMAGEGSRFVIMGNDMGTAQQHTVRLWGMYKGFIAHNALRGRSSDGILVALKVQSGGLGEYNDNYAISGRHLGIETDCHCQQPAWGFHGQQLVHRWHQPREQPPSRAATVDQTCADGPRRRTSTGGMDA